MTNLETLRANLAEDRRTSEKLRDVSITLHRAQEDYETALENARVVASSTRDPWPLLKPVIEAGQAVVRELAARTKCDDAVQLPVLSPATAGAKLDAYDHEVRETFRALGRRLVGVQQRVRERLEHSGRAYWIAVADEIAARIPEEHRVNFAALAIAQQRAEDASAGEAVIESACPPASATAALHLIETEFEVVA